MFLNLHYAWGGCFNAQSYHSLAKLPAKIVTVQWLDRSRSDGQVGEYTRVVAKLQIVRYIAAHVAELPQHSKARAELLRV